MSVETRGQLVTRPFGTSSDPALPVFQWTAEVVAVGDASGGTLTVGCVFKPGLLYSVEGVAAGQEGGVVTAATLRLVTRDGGLIMPVGFTVVSSVIEAPSPVLAPFPWPIFRPDGSADAVLDHSRGNDATITALRLHAWGYAWDLEANKQETGPIRP